jgi:phosphomannomutase/phosphoglucomutase
MEKGIFREYDIRGIADTELTDETIYKIGRAYAKLLDEKTDSDDRAVCLGWDVRDSSQRIRKQIRDALVDSGVDVHEIGMVPTPVVYFTGLYNDLDGAIQITGSHNPSEYNGLKMMVGEETLFGEAIQRLQSFAEVGDFEDRSTGEVVEQTEAVDQYVDWIKGDINPGDKDLKVALDCGNGAASLLAERLVEEVFGAEIVPLYCEPNPDFPNHHPDPTVEKNLEDLIATVQKQDCDIGIAYDGDGDRIGVVDDSGSIIWGDMLMVLLSRSVLNETPGATIIGEVKCSQLLFDDIAERGGEPIMGRVGHSLIKQKLKETGAELAGEMSGHIFFNDRFFGFDDALYATCRVLEILSRSEGSLSEQLADLPEVYSTPEIREPCDPALKFKIPSIVADYFSKDFEVNTIDGARINFGQGWGLVRASNTQAVLVLRVEAETPEYKDQYLERIRAAVEEAKETLVD